MVRKSLLEVGAKTSAGVKDVRMVVFWTVGKAGWDGWQEERLGDAGSSH